MRTEKFFLAELLSRFHYYPTLYYYSRTTYVVVHRVGYSATSTLPRLCALCSWWLCFRTTVRWTLGTKQSSTGSWYTLFQNSIFDLKYGSEEKGSSLCKCSILLGFFMSKKLERLRSEILSEDKITNLLGFLTK